MSDHSLTVTNADCWLATQPIFQGESAPLHTVVRAPMFVLPARNAATLLRVVTSVTQDIDAARVALCAQCGVKTADGTQYEIRDQRAFAEGWAVLMAERVTLPGVRAIQPSDFAPTAVVTPDAIARCGALFADGVPA